MTILDSLYRPVLIKRLSPLLELSTAVLMELKSQPVLQMVIVLANTKQVEKRNNKKLIVVLGFIQSINFVKNTFPIIVLGWSAIDDFFRCFGIFET